MKTAVVVQARMASQRLPGKVLLDLAGAPLLQRMLERVQAAQSPSEILVATSADRSCDPIAGLCESLAVRCYRGHPTDLIDRHWRAGMYVGADAVVKIPSDCPLIDPGVVDRVIGAFCGRLGSVDYVGNLRPPSYPEGNQVEVMTMSALETAWREARQPHEREFITPYFWQHAERFRIHNVAWETGLDYSKTHRWTVDYIHDYRLVRAVYRALHSPNRPIFGLDQIVEYLRQHPKVAQLNKQWRGTPPFRRRLEDGAPSSFGIVG